MLIKSLPKIAARVLKNTWGVPPQYKQKLELIQEAYGQAAVENDFTAWCEEVKDTNPRYPVTAYLKVVDSRLGSASKDDEKDPRIAEISAVTYRLVHRPSPPRSVQEMLVIFSADEIISALNEYVEGIEEREYSFAVRAFFIEGGCAAIITARKQREQERQKQVQQEKHEMALLDSLIEKNRKKREDEDRQSADEDAEPQPTAEELFGPRG